MKRVTKRQAQKVLSEVRRQFKPYCQDGGEGPELVMDFDWSGRGPAIVWDGGPFEWAILATSGGIDEEMTTLAMEMPEFREYLKTGRMTNPVKVTPVVAPEGVFLEPITSWALGMYPKDW